MAETIQNFLDEPLAVDWMTYEDGILQQVANPSPELAAQLQDRLLSEQRELLALPSDETGIDMARVHAYRRTMGAPRKHLLFLQPDAYQEAQRIVTNYYTPSVREAGQFAHYHDVLMVRRSPRLEDINGPAISESFGIHEIAHSYAPAPHIVGIVETANTAWWQVRKKTARTMRLVPTAVGFVRTVPPARPGGIATSYNTLLEEAYAELERGIYTAGPLQQPTGFAPPDMVDTYDPTQMVHPRYWLRELGTNDAVSATFAGAGALGACILEDLSTVDVSTVDTLRLARRISSGNYDISHFLDTLIPKLAVRFWEAQLDDFQNPNTLNTRMPILRAVAQARKLRQTKG